MTYENATIPQTYAGRGSQTYTNNSVLTWLLWLRLWVMNTCGMRPAIARRSRSKSSQILPRARRLSNAHFARCPLPPARNLGAVRALLPRGLSPTQTQERLARLSVLGRVRIYQICFWGSVLLRRAVLVCYDHGWWRAPLRYLRGGIIPASLRPP